MADIFSKDRLGPNAHRADEIHIHHRTKRSSPGPLIGLGVIGLGLLALWGYSKSRSHAQGAACGQTTVQFEQHRAMITKATQKELVALATCLKADPSQMVKLEGRADPGELSYNSSLPQGRADAIAAELNALGVPASQVAVMSNPTPCAETAGKCRTVSAIPERSER